MDSMLKELFGGEDDDRTTQARDYISRYEQGPIDQGYSNQEAYENFHRVSQRVDPATMQRAAEQTFARMDPSQRAQLAQYLQQQSGYQMTGAQDDPRQMAGMVSQIQRDNPGGLESLFGGGSSGGGGIGEAIGNLLGGGDDAQRSSGQRDEGGGFPGGTLGKIALGGIAAFAMKEMLGGGDDDRQRRRSV